jgi:hypothetical protein
LTLLCESAAASSTQATKAKRSMACFLPPALKNLKKIKTNFKKKLKWT